MHSETLAERQPKASSNRPPAATGAEAAGSCRHNGKETGNETVNTDEGHPLPVALVGPSLLNSAVVTRTLTDTAARTGVIARYKSG